MKRPIVWTIFVITAITIGMPAAASALTYNHNKIIDDIVFDNTNTMNAAQIDTFLNSFPNSCISTNSGFAAVDPTGYNPTNGFSYGGYVSAGQVIYDAAQVYGINPQVLLATLQKEQSLVAGGSGFCEDGNMNKYAAAVGYGCPDGGTSYSYSGLSLYRRNGNVVSSVSSTCVNSAAKAGFSQQIIRAAWLFKFGEQRSKGNINWAVIKGNWDNSDDPQSCYSGPMTQGTFVRCPSGSAAYYDGYTTIDNTAVHIDDGATAALYWYTPHFSGNQNFFNIFSNWFGSPYQTISVSYNVGDGSVDSTGDIAVIPIQLATAPISTVQLNFGLSDSLVAKVVGNSSLVFTPSNWNQPQNIVVQGLPSSASSHNFNLQVLYINSPDGAYDQSATQYIQTFPLLWSNVNENAVYRLYNSSTGKHAYAVSQDVLSTLQSNGYSIETTLGYQCTGSTNTPIVVDNSLGLVRGIDSSDITNKQAAQPTILYSNAFGAIYINILKNSTGDDTVLSGNSSEINTLLQNGYTSVTSFLLCPQGDSPVYRLVDNSNKSHFYTASGSELDSAINVGFAYEGTAFYINKNNSVPVYRLNDPIHHNHFYTSSQAESNAAQSLGYKYEGIAFDAK